MLVSLVESANDDQMQCCVHFYCLLIIYFITRFDDLKLGKHVGTDKYGNKYFENDMYFVGTYLTRGHRQPKGIEIFVSDN